MEALRVALLGAGTVGSGFVKLLTAHAERLATLGTEVRLTGILVRDPAKPRPAWVPGDRLTTEADALLADADVVVEAMGGTDRARELVLAALEAGLPVITANKALLAEAWDALKPHALEGLLFYEAAVMAGTPVIEPLSGALRGSNLIELHAILNGTTNYILGRMEAGATFQEALAEAQAKGYAEADPTLDVAGIDAAHKLTVLARLVADPSFPWEAVRRHTRGIEHLTPAVLRAARDEGKAVRLVASLYPQERRWHARVRPVKLPLAHPLAQASLSQNALYFKGDAVGEVCIVGGGAGSLVTASGLLGDLYRLLEGYPGHPPLPAPAPAPAIDALGFEEV